MSVADHSSVNYEYRYSPPVSPKSQPHGFKRKASSQDDELEGFKKLRLQEPGQPLTRARKVRPLSQHGRKPIYIDEGLVPLEDHDIELLEPIVHHPQPALRPIPMNDDFDDFMPIDDTADRVWVHDLDKEIAEIEAEEERRRNALLSEAGDVYAKVPEHILKQNLVRDDAAANMQIILYKDPTSISIPEEEDAVRKTIMEARRRVRQMQATNETSSVVDDPSSQGIARDRNDHERHDPDVDMDVD